MSLYGQFKNTGHILQLVLKILESLTFQFGELLWTWKERIVTERGHAGYNGRSFLASLQKALPRHCPPTPPHPMRTPEVPALVKQTSFVQNQKLILAISFSVFFFNYIFKKNRFICVGKGHASWRMCGVQRTTCWVGLTYHVYTGNWTQAFRLEGSVFAHCTTSPAQSWQSYWTRPITWEIML